MKNQARARRVLLVVGHGRTTSLCHRLAQGIREALEREGVEYRVQDLLADGFDPRLRLGPEERHATAVTAEQDPLVHRYQEDVRWADTYVVVHPVWWFAPPAILKGWVDRVLVDGVALMQRVDDPPAGILGGRRALVVQTFNAARAIDKVFFRGIAELFWRRAVFHSVGVGKVKRFALYGAATLTPGKLDSQKKRLERSLLSLLS